MIVEYGGIRNNTFCRNIFGEQNDLNIINSFDKAMADSLSSLNILSV